LTFNGKTGEIQNVNLSGVAPGTYTFSQGTSGSLKASVAGTITAAGTGVAGTYNAVTVAATSGTGTGATVNLTVTGTAITGAVLSGGTGYKVGDTLTIDNGQFGGVAGSGSATLTVAATGVLSDSLLLTGVINGTATTEQITVKTNEANATQTLNFSRFGVSMDIKSYQAQTGNEITSKLITLANGTPSAAGQLVVGQGNNSALKFQSGANSDAFIQIDTLNIQTGSTGATAGSSTEMMTLGTRISQTGAGNLGTLGNLDTIDTWQTAFKNAAAAVDAALEFISTERATYGSQMNRLSYVSTNLQAQSTNLQNSRSAIIDTDFAAETAKLTKGQIMQQAATAMLAQANQMPNVILSLLK
jgi:flagellin